MGFPPPKDAIATTRFPLPPAPGTIPAPGTTTVNLAAHVHFAASFSLKTPSFEFCGFGIPSFSFDFSFAFDFDFSFLFSFPPSFFFVLELPCGLALPISLGPGGGRVGSPVPEFGAEFT